MQSVLAADFPACVKQADPPLYFSALKIALSDKGTGSRFVTSRGLDAVLIK